MRATHAILMIGTFLVLAIAFGSPAEASCTDNVGIGSYRISRTPYLYDYTVTQDVTGSFWALGSGDPRVGRGVDNGSFPAFTPPYGDPYYRNDWLYRSASYGTYMFGTWSHEGVDGCIVNTPDPQCAVLLLTDQIDGTGYVLVATDTRSNNSHPRYIFRDDDTGLVMAPIPVPVIDGIDASGGSLGLDVVPGEVPGGAFYLDPDCPDPLVGYRIYQAIVPPGSSEIVERNRGDGVWELAVGGATPDGRPLAPGAPGRIAVTGCIDQGSYYLATSLVFDSGFETVHLSASSVAVACGTCADVDLDGDGLGAGPCEATTRHDCDDADEAIYPGAAEVCDGRNNDCRHPDWPALTGTSEVDEDGDGPSGCEGDPCPRDPDDDGDGDGFCADLDTCPDDFDPAQTDTDVDGIGDACDACVLDFDNDVDHDGFCAQEDNCPIDANPGQADADDDGLGDDCDKCPLDPDNDIDNDRLCGDVDPCPFDARNDRDGDGLCPDVDPCPLDALNDIDADDHCGNVDNCPFDANPDQVDTDEDAVGDRCDFFGREIEIESGPNPDSSKAADIDGDGDADVVRTVGPGIPGNEVGWFENLDSKGTTWAFHPIDLAGGLVDVVATADFDVDGDVDLLFRHGFDTVWLENDGSGSQWHRHLLAERVYGSAERYRILRADNDRFPDVLIQFGDDVLLYRSRLRQSDDWFREVIDTMPRVDYIDVGDIDNDGYTDIISVGHSTPGSTDDGLVVYLNQNRGIQLVNHPLRWKRSVVAVESNFKYPAVGDVDGDGDGDIVASVFPVFTPTLLVWYENPGTGDVPWEQHLIRSGQNVHVPTLLSDIDRDGDLDIAASNSNRGVSWYQNRTGDPAEPWRRRDILWARDSLAGVEVYDIDGDGLMDVVAGLRFADTLAWYRNTGFEPDRTGGEPPAPSGPEIRRTVWPSDRLDAGVTLMLPW